MNTDDLKKTKGRKTQRVAIELVVESLGSVTA